MKIIGKKEIKVDTSLAEEVKKRCGENVFLCYQCKKCASGCPSRMFMDSTPAELMRYVQLGMADEVMKKNSVWYCLTCHTCSARCPQNIDITNVIDTIRIIVQEKKIKAQTGTAPIFYRIWMIMLRYTGRMYEVGLTGMFNLITGKPFKDLSLGFKMIKKGKLKLLPTIKKPFSTMRLFKRARRLKK